MGTLAGDDPKRRRDQEIRSNLLIKALPFLYGPSDSVCVYGCGGGCGCIQTKRLHLKN